MFSPRSFGKKKSTTSSKLYLSSTFSESVSHITSDAYGLHKHTMKDRTTNNTIERAMDFVPYNNSLGQGDSATGSKQTGCGSGIWQFIQFDAKPLSPPRLKRRPLTVSTILRDRSIEKSYPPSPLKRVPPLVLPGNKSRLRVGDNEEETRKPLSSLDSEAKRKISKKDRSSVRLQAVKGMIKNILTPRTSNRSRPRRYVATLDMSATESLSSDDDDDSIWNEVSPKYAAQRDLSIKYSRRSQINDGSMVQSEKVADIAKRALRPNYTHVNASYWTEKNLRPYMEDRILLDRVGSMVVTNNDSKHVCGLEMSALLQKLDNVNNLVNGSPGHPEESMPYIQEPISIYGVFDGHAGARASQFCSDWFSSYLRRQNSFIDNIPEALKSTFANIDKDFMRTGKEDGTTACTCVIIGGQRIICANAGDSRAIVVKKDGTVVPLSKDHKPGSAEEMNRITDLGGKVLYHAGWRVEGKLAVSRAIGDASLKPYVTSDPDIRDYSIQPDDWFLVMASDGIWVSIYIYL